jgi:hypothetical protein
MAGHELLHLLISMAEHDGTMMGDKARPLQNASSAIFWLTHAAAALQLWF